LKSGIHCRLLKIIENGTIRKLGYGFLFAFHSNYMILSCIISENRNFFIHPAFDAPVRGLPIASAYCHNVWGGKTGMVWLPDGENSSRIC